MLAWWNGLTLTAQVFAAIAVPATAIMVLQSILALLGIGMDTDIDGDGVPDADVDHDGLGLISIRGLVAFFSVGGWTGYVAETGGLPLIVSVLLALAAGLLALFGVALLFKSVYRLQASGNLSIENAVGKTAKVYLPIPPKGAGQGKISVLVQDRLVELDAVNEESRPLPTGESVLVCCVADSQTVSVKGLKTEENKNNQGGISKWNRA